MANALLDMVSMRGRVLTGDALYCQRHLCRRVVEDGGDYVVIVKSNQKSLYEDIELCFSRPVSGEPYAYTETEDRHGDRWEVRRLWATCALAGYLDWPGHRQVIKLESRRWLRGREARQVRYAITSLGPDTSADKLLSLIRGHWGIENRVHYVRGVSMGEDGCRVRTGAAPQAMATVRNAAINILRLLGAENIARAFRENAWNPSSLADAFGLSPPQ